MKKDIIVAARSDGFGERMCALLNAMCLSELLHMDFRFKWSKNTNSVVQNFTQKNTYLVANETSSARDFFGENFINHYHTDSVDMSELCSIWELKNKSIDDFIFTSKEEWGWYAPPHNLTKIVCDLSEIEYRKKLKNCWQKIQFNSAVSAIIHEANLKSKDENFVAIHIRSGDNVYERSMHTRWLWYALDKSVSFYLVYEIIAREIHKGSKVILFGDDPTTNIILKDYINNSCGNSNVYIIDDFMDFSNINCDQRVLFEIVFMSNAKTIYSGNSGFSRVAYFIGNSNFYLINYYFTHQEKKEIIYKNLNKLPINKKHAAFSLFYVYSLFENKQDIFENIQLLEYGLSYDNENDVFRLCLIDTHLKYKNYREANQLLQDFFICRKEQFFEFLLQKTFMVKKFNCDKIFKSYCIKQDLFKYKYIFYVFCRLALDVYNHIEEFKEQYNLAHIEILENFYYISKQKQFHQMYDGELFNDIRFRLQEINDKYLIKFLSDYSAQYRVKNHLSYKLGKAILAVKDLKSFYSSILDITQAIRNHNQLGNSTRRYFDEAQALKIQNSLPYRLGKLILMAHKNWYKGGYFKLFFDIRRLRDGKK
ncbi:hypothetical protein ACTN5O_001269 [Campylobacter jejuni]|nr:hypothetical protein [Campylobacter jejuni]EEO6978091.1 hypothetical protein [Campylobacter jejuni]MCW1365544.1 hypothetical protein [Campylobacter jejuni]